MFRAGAESGATILHANGMRRFLVLAGLLLGTWIAMLLIASGVGSASAELGEMLHRAGTQTSSTNQPGYREQFLIRWKDGLFETLRLFAFPPFALKTPILLLWLATAATLLSALALLAPLVGGRHRDGSGMPLTWAITGGGVLGGGLGVGVMLVLIDIPRIIARWNNETDPFSNTSPWTIVVSGLLVWTLTGWIWSLSFRRAGSATMSGQIARQVRWLFAGTGVELALAAPTFAAAARRDSCYCAWGSWFAILIGTVVLTVLCGPMLVLLWTREARLRWIRGACGTCGYPLRSASAVCPECGAQRTPAASKETAT